MKSISAGFVVPISDHNFSPFRNPPLGSLYLLTILKQEFGTQIDESLIDLRGVTPKNTVYHVPEKDVYLYSVSTLDFDDVKQLVNELREVYPGAKHIAGGCHIDIFPEESSEVFDAISLGEGEESIKRIFRDLSISELKSVYKQEEEIDLNNYPIGSREYLPKSAVVQKNILIKEYKGLLGTSVIFSRGCPYNCYFCANVTRGRTRFRSPDLILEELEYLKREYNIEALAIKDDQSIPVNKEQARPMLEALVKAGLKWRGQTRANGVDPEMIKLAKKSGCIEIAVGVESVSQRALEIINKNIDLDEAKDYLRFLKQEGIDRRLLLIMGLPGESEDISERTIEFIKENEPSSVLLSLFSPFPGSETFRNPEKFGIKLNPNVPFDHYINVFGRFDQNEKPFKIFEYEEETPFGKGKNMEKIIEEYQTVQSFLRINGYNDY